MENILLKGEDFEKLLGEKLSDRVKNKIDRYELAFFPITKEEEHFALIKIMDVLLDPNLMYSGPHRLKQWEKGWEQNLSEFSASKKTDDISPHYFGKYDINRLSQTFVKAASPNYERNTLYAVLDYIFDKYAKSTENIYEFGCGTGHVLLKARETNPRANLFGLDWVKSSQKILKEMSGIGIVNNIKPYHFDFFNPDNSIKIEKDSLVLTVMALEQVGENHKKFVSYLLKNKPGICIHIEPVEELLDEHNLLDNLSIKYARKRNYLKGFLTYLRKLESEGKIKIHEAKRTNVGSFFIENSSMVVWSPIK